MTLKKKLAMYGAIALAIFVVDVVWGFIRTASARFGNKPSRVFISGTIHESKSRGAFIESLEITPKRIAWHGKEIVISEAWLEHSTELVYVYVIIPCVMEYPYYRKVNGYHLCFNCAERDALRTDPRPFFVVEGKGHGLREQWPNDPNKSVYFCEQIDSLGMLPAKILLTDNWNLEDRPSLEVKRSTE